MERFLVYKKTKMGVIYITSILAPSKEAARKINNEQSCCPDHKYIITKNDEEVKLHQGSIIFPDLRPTG